MYSAVERREGKATVSYFIVLFQYLSGMTEYKHGKQRRYCGSRDLQLRNTSRTTESNYWNQSVHFPIVLLSSGLRPM
jgi:hypothetical protein